MARQPGPGGRGGGGGGTQVAPPETMTQRAWKGLNLTDSRLSIDDDELYRCENAMPLGRGIAPTPIYNGSAGVSLHASLIKESLSCQLTYGANTLPHPVVICVFEDGSAYMRDMFGDGAVDTQVAVPGTFSASPLGTSLAIWQDGPVLIQDDHAGYLKWDGTTLTIIDSTKVGHNVSVFSGYTFLQTAPRTITFTAPNTFSDFTSGDGAGTFKITDDAFQGAIERLISTVSQLWIVGVAAIDALGNIATASGVTTFSVTNAVTTIGTAFGDSVIGYYRSLVFSTGYSLHSLLGVTPQKLSGKLDQLFSSLSAAITFGPRGAVTKLNGIIVLCYIYTFTDPQTAVASTRLVCFAEGKFFLATTPDLAGNRVLDIFTQTTRTAPELYGIDAGGFIYRIFARTGDAMKGTVTIESKLLDGGHPIVGNQAFHIGFDFSAPAATGMTSLTVTVASEATSVQLAPLALAFLAASGDAWLGTRYSMYRNDAPIIGQRVGWTLQYPAGDLVTLEAAHLEVAPTGQGGWDTVVAGPAPFIFLTPQGGVFTWLNV